MDFFLVGFGLWGSIVLSLILFLVGWWKKSWIAYVISAILLLIPTIVLSTQGGMYILFILFPVVIFLIALSTRRGA